jgi:hypothetical protein
MNTNGGTVLGCIVLQTQDASTSKLPRLDFPFTELQKVETGNHITSFDSTCVAPFDFWHGGRDAESAKMFVSTRGLSLSGFRVGEATEENLTRRCIQYLLAINSGPTEDEKKLPYLDLAYNKVFSKINERFFLSLDISSSSPKFVLMTRDMPVYFTAFCDNESTYLMWTNEAGIEERLREHYGERFYYYRMRPFLNGVCVVQSVYLKKKIMTWQHQLQDRLKVMNALEVHLFRRVITEDSPVNSLVSNQS